MSNGSNEEWLDANRALRMDANESIFPESRRQLHLDRYEFAAKYCTGKIVLDAACGTGYGSAILAKSAKHVTGIDIDEMTIEYARSKYGSDNTTFNVGCVELTEIQSDSIDVVVSFETVEHTLCPNSHMIEISRVLSPSGVAVLSVPNRWGLSDHHFWDFDVRMLQRILKGRFGRVDYYYNNSSNDNNRKKGIGPLNLEEADDAECLVAVCSDVNADHTGAHGYQSVLHEIYDGVFERHQEFLRLQSELKSDAHGFTRSIKKMIKRVIAR
ncbi:class I SAM-dependent methyltransferase [Elongatibacter sediminis]|uniref:Class I SAM-dependent methyltransferase n=1 Tax=Elongatibacter sediminis TaxID=3119006 RepID=A0AAW9R9J1_9GAMM